MRSTSVLGEAPLAAGIPILALMAREYGVEKVNLRWLLALIAELDALSVLRQARLREGTRPQHSHPCLARASPAKPQPAPRTESEGETFRPPPGFLRFSPAGC